MEKHILFDAQRPLALARSPSEEDDRGEEEGDLFSMHEAVEWRQNKDLPPCCDEGW